MLGHVLSGEMDRVVGIYRSLREYLHALRGRRRVRVLEWWQARVFIVAAGGAAPWTAAKMSGGTVSAAYMWNAQTDAVCTVRTETDVHVWIWRSDARHVTWPRALRGLNRRWGKETRRKRMEIAVAGVDHFVVPAWFAANLNHRVVRELTS